MSLLLKLCNLGQVSVFPSLLWGCGGELRVLSKQARKGFANLSLGAQSEVWGWTFKDLQSPRTLCFINAEKKP